MTIQWELGWGRESGARRRLTTSMIPESADQMSRTQIQAQLQCCWSTSALASSDWARLQSCEFFGTIEQSWVILCLQLMPLCNTVGHATPQARGFCHAWYIATDIVTTSTATINTYIKSSTIAKLAFLVACCSSCHNCSCRPTQVPILSAPLFLYFAPMQSFACYTSCIV